MKGAAFSWRAAVHYHVWFKTKQRKWLLVGDIEEMVKQIIADTANRHGIRLLECETMVDHVHMLLESTDDAELSRAMHLIKGASAREILRVVPDIRMDAGISHSWQKRYGAKIVPPGAVDAVRGYIRSQKDRPAKYEH